MGLTNAGIAIALEAVLPPATNRWVALYTTLPGRDGSGAVEVADPSYARVAHDTWTIVGDADGVTISNVGAIAFPHLAGDVLDVVGWGIVTASTAGTILVSGLLLNGSGAPIVRDFAADDQPSFADGVLTLRVS